MNTEQQNSNEVIVQTNGIGVYCKCGGIIYFCTDSYYSEHDGKKEVEDFFDKGYTVGRISQGDVQRLFGCKCNQSNTINEPIKDWIIKEDNVCPDTNEQCDDECCPTGAVCNLKSTVLNENNISDCEPIKDEELGFELQKGEIEDCYIASYGNCISQGRTVNEAVQLLIEIVIYATTKSAIKEKNLIKDEELKEKFDKIFYDYRYKKYVGLKDSINLCIKTSQQYAASQVNNNVEDKEEVHSIYDRYKDSSYNHFIDILFEKYTLIKK
jgi:predicted RNase H-like HicB family nuclease